MKQTRIQFRDIQKSDYPVLEKMIAKTWEYEKYCSPTIANQMATYYLASCLANQTYTCVAENDGVAVGIILGKIEKNFQPTEHDAKQERLALFDLKKTEEGRKMASLYEGFDQLNQRLLANSGYKFDGELALFIVSSDQRGNGIGGRLYNHFIRYTQAAQIEDFYLFTDSGCNVGFYEHQGLQRLGEETYNLQPYLDEDMTFYVYGQRVSTKAKKLA